MKMAWSQVPECYVGSDKPDTLDSVQYNIGVLYLAFTLFLTVTDYSSRANGKILECPVIAHI
jgi:hypothetical protein